MRACTLVDDRELRQRGANEEVFVFTIHYLQGGKLLRAVSEM